MENQNVEASVQSTAYDLARKFLRVAIEFHNDHPDVLSPTQDQYTDFPSGYELMFNIQMKDFVVNKFAHYGFIAREKYTSNYIIAIRGTQTIAEGVIDEEIALIPWAAVPQAGKVEEGFANLYASLHLLYPGSEDPKDKINSIGNYNKITMIGHSLGSSLVTLYGTHMATKTMNEVTIYTLASPNTGDKDFVDYYQKVIKESHRFYNTLDKVPQMLQDKDSRYKHVQVPHPLKPDFHVNNTDKCNHYFHTYLYLLEGNSKVAILDLECRV